MIPDKLTVYDLFQRERRYVVPLYQRAYVWSEEEQWEPLWEDIERQSDACLAAPGHVAPRSHFLGAVVLNVRQIVGSRVARSEVIDGQQRLTTLQLFLAALRDYALSMESAQTVKIRRLVVHEDETAGSEESFKVWPTNADRETFRTVMTSGSVAAVMKAFKASRTSDLTRIAAAYTFFSQKIVEYVGAAGDEAGARDRRIIDGLFQAMRTALQLIVIELESTDDPQVIFETLNARGQPLLPSDLIRNYVFMQAANDPATDPDSLYNSYWRPFDDKRLAQAIAGEDRFWHVEERQGRLTRPRIDLFIFHYLVMKTEHELNIRTLFREFRDWRSADPIPTEALLADLKMYSHIFESLIAPVGNDRAAVFARRLKALDTSTVYPLLLFLLALPSERLALQARDRIIEDVESWLVRRFVCGLTTKNYNGFFLSLLQKLKRAEIGEDLAAVARAELASSTEVTRNWPADAEFRRAWLSRPVYVRSRSDRSGMILRAIEDQIRTRRNEAVALPESLSVEHLLPQKGSLADYPYAAPMPLETDETAERCRARVIDTIGNLTLLTCELNASASNGPFPEKVRKIVADSDLRLNAWLRDTPPATWDEASIRVRADLLFSTVSEIWSSPPKEEPAAVGANRGEALPPTTASSLEATAAANPLSRPDGAVRDFEAAMRNIHARASSETSYRPSYFLRMIDDRGGVGAARALLSGQPSEGFARLWEMGRLDLSVEALVLDPRWHEIFNEDELAIAKRRLAGAGFERVGEGRDA